MNGVRFASIVGTRISGVTILSRFGHTAASGLYVPYIGWLDAMCGTRFGNNSRSFFWIPHARIDH